jgi:TPR repeat protein
MLALRADQGDADAQAQLGFMHEHGRGVAQSYDLAVHWYLCAAEQGHATAQYLLGLMYDKGRGVQRNDMLAYQWLNVAVARAPQRAKEYYARIRDAVAKKLTLAQITEAQRLAAKFVPKDARMPGHLGFDR